MQTWIASTSATPHGGTPLGGTPLAAGTRSVPSVPEAPFAILVVDDNNDSRELVARRFAKSGYGVTTAGDGAEALSLLEKQPFDLVLLDIMMPGMSGLEVLERIRAHHPPATLPVIMATAKDQSDDIVRALAMGANDYVTKPLDLAVLTARVNTNLSLKRSVQQIVDLERQLSERNAELETINGQLEVANATLMQAADRTKRELDMAARVQEAFLPTAMPRVPGLDFAWAFRPCQQLAGDFLNVCRLDDDQVGFYVLDVAGHGVAASLLAVSVARVLSPAGSPDSILVRKSDGDRPLCPAEVAERLNRRWTWNESIRRYITLFYAVVNARTHELTYVSAGHPAAVRIDRDRNATILEGSGLPIGVGDRYEQQTAQLEPGDRVYLYSDGITEAMTPHDELFGAHRLIDCLRRHYDVPLHESVAKVLHDIERWSAGRPIRDDVSILAVEYTSPPMP